MSHDKIRAAARKRMADTGEPYTAARREAIKEHQAAGAGIPPPEPRRFAIRYSKTGIDKITAWLDALTGEGPGASRLELDPDEIRVRMGSYKLDIPLRSVRSVQRSQFRTRGTTGVHASRGRLLVNGSADGLVELTIEPPCYTDRTPSTMFTRARVNSLIVSLVDPDGLIAALEHVLPPEREGRT